MTSNISTIRLPENHQAENTDPEEDKDTIYSYAHLIYWLPIRYAIPNMRDTDDTLWTDHIIFKPHTRIKRTIPNQSV